MQAMQLTRGTTDCIPRPMFEKSRSTSYTIVVKTEGKGTIIRVPFQIFADMMQLVSDQNCYPFSFSI